VPGSVLQPLALYESSRLKEADVVYEQMRVREVKQMNQMQEGNYTGEW
jgi:hypothetical protein